MVLEGGGLLDRNFSVLGNEFGGANTMIEGWPFTDEWKNINEHLGYWIFGGFYVNSYGERFINEKLVADYPLALGGDAILRAGKAYCVMDSTYYNGCQDEGIYELLGSPDTWASHEEALYYCPTSENAVAHLKEAIKSGWAYQADSIEELAEYFGLDNLVSSVETYNKWCEEALIPLYLFLKKCQKTARSVLCNSNKECYNYYKL